MGTVYKARDTRLGRTVALKFLPLEVEGREKFSKRFFLEAQAASALDHPNTCTIYGIEEEAETHFIVMAYYQGRTLDKLIASSGMPWDRAVSIGLQIASGLAAAHRHGIIHRDVKPNNIIIEVGDVVKILDFGLAKFQDVNLTTLGATMGTCAYMSPEQVRGEPAHVQVDVWAFGVVLYELLTGTRPFKGSFPAVFNAILQETPPLPGTLCAGMPPSLENIVSRCIEKDSQRRYQSMDAVIADLETVVSARLASNSTRSKDKVSTVTISAAEERPSIPFYAPRSRRRVQRWFVIGGFSLLLVAGGIMYWNSASEWPRLSRGKVVDDGAGNIKSDAVPVEAEEPGSVFLGALGGESIEEPSTSSTELAINSAPLERGAPARREQAAIEGNRLTFDLWTNKGRENLSFKEGEGMILFVRASRPAYVRVLYRFADETRVLLVDNFRINGESIGDAMKVGEFTCVPPFGSETLLAFAQDVPFPPLKTVSVDGYEILEEDLETVAAQTRGFKKGVIEQAEYRLHIITRLE